jgi:hypothetical protein
VSDRITDPFPSAVLGLFASEPEVDIETWGADGAPHRATIWIVTVDDVPYIRSWKGSSARWYREIRVESHGAVHVAGRRVPVRAVPVGDDLAAVEACSAGLREKYAGDPSTPSMVRQEVLDTTLRLDPA